MAARRRTWSGVLGILAILSSVPALAAIARPGGVSATCAPVAFAFEGDPPAYVEAEFGHAAAEIERRTGLTFVRAVDAPARLGIHWRRGVHAVGADQVRIDERLIGSGMGRWTVDGLRRVLAGAAIEIDARRQWTRGLVRGDSITAVLVHELGHVVGLTHSSDPASFMFDRARPDKPHWTPQELARLAEIGRQAGCSAADDLTSFGL